MSAGYFFAPSAAASHCETPSAGKALPATILSVLRQGVLLIPVLYLLNGLLGLNGVIYGQALTDCITVLLSIVFWRKLSHNLYA